MALKTAPPLFLDPPADLLDRFPNLLSLARELALGFVYNKIADDQPLQVLGSMLWDALDAEASFAAARKKAGMKCLPLVIRSSNHAIQFLPWECLHHPTLGFLARDRRFALSRGLEEDPEDAEPAPKGPLKVLLFTSLPDDVDPEKGRLNIEAEQEAILEALDPMIRDGRVHLTMPDDGRFSAFCELVKENFHLIFLSGHGAYEDLPGSPSQARFFFESEDGGSNGVGAEDLAEALAGQDTRCLVLSACSTGKHASDDLASGLAGSLWMAGLPHVVAMRESVLDAAATRFEAVLCDMLSQGNRMDVAVQAGRMAMVDGLPKSVSRESRPLETPTLGQWSLPICYSAQANLPLINWDFTPQPAQEKVLLRETFQGLTVPKRFIGRRKEQRRWSRDLAAGKLAGLMFIGEGGRGKTSLTVRLAHKLARKGFAVLCYGAAAQTGWRATLEEWKMAMGPEFSRLLDRQLLSVTNEDEALNRILNALMQWAEHKLVMVFDNLETVQDPSTGALTDPGLQAWWDVCLKREQGNRPVLLVTSRWSIPGFAGDQRELETLERSSYGDFLRFSQELPDVGWTKERYKELFGILGGNYKALEFMTQGVKTGMDIDSFTQSLAEVKQEMRVFLALEKVVGHLSQDQRTLLERFRVYESPVVVDGAWLVGADLEDPELALSGLVQRSLVDMERGRFTTYETTPLVRDWLQKKRGPCDQQIREKAARMLMHQSLNLEKTITSALAAHAALTEAGLLNEAHELVLEALLGRFMLNGMYGELAQRWLPPLLKSDNLKIVGAAHNKMGMVYHALGSYDKAEPHFTQALAIYQDLKYLKGQGEALHNLSQIYHAKGDYDTALEYLEKSLKIDQKIGDRSGEGTTLNNISQVYHAKGDYDTALAYLEKSLKIHQQIGDRSGEGACLNNISQIYKAKGDYDTALAYLEKSLKIRQEIGDRSGEGATLNNMGTIAQTKGDNDTALEYLEKSLKILQKIGDRSGEGTTLNNISQIYDAKGDYDTALVYLEKSLKIRQQIGDRSGEGATLSNMGTIAHAKGDYDTALAYLEKSLKICQEIGNRSGEGATLNNISQIYDAKGDNDTALAYLEKSLKIQQQIGDRSGEGTTLNNISQIYDAKGDFDTALVYLEKSLKIRQQVGDRSGEGATLNNISQIYKAKGDNDTALAYLEKSLKIQQQIGDRSGEGTTLNNMAGIAHAKGDYDTALEYLQASLEIRKQLGDKSGMCATLFNMGHISWQADRQQEALSTWLIVYRLAAPMGLAQVLQALDSLAKQLGQDGLAFWQKLAEGLEREGDEKPDS